MSRIDTTDLLSRVDGQQYYVTQISSFSSKGHCILRCYRFHLVFVLHNPACAISEILYVSTMYPPIVSKVIRCIRVSFCPMLERQERAETRAITKGCFS